MQKCRVIVFKRSNKITVYLKYQKSVLYHEPSLLQILDSSDLFNTMSIIVYLYYIYIIYNIYIFVWVSELYVENC